MKYLEKIKDEKMRRALLRAYSLYGYKARFLPSTITGKYHPPDEKGYGGLLRHMDKTAWLIDQIATEYQFSDTVRDMLITAAYFHDLGKVKQTSVTGELIYRKDETIFQTKVTRNVDSLDNHPLIGAGIAREFLKREGVKGELIIIICDLIAKHMSHWYPWLPQPETELEKLFALADFIVSREEFRIQEGEKISLWQKLKKKIKH